MAEAITGMVARGFVIDALTALGYSIVEAQRAVQGLPLDVSDVEDRLRLALASVGN
jgi:holliday junction DNA helicase RuvA